MEIIRAKTQMMHTMYRNNFRPIRIPSLLREVAAAIMQQRHGYYTVTAPYLSNPAAHWGGPVVLTKRGRMV